MNDHLACLAAVVVLRDPPDAGRREDWWVAQGLAFAAQQGRSRHDGLHDGCNCDGRVALNRFVDLGFGWARGLVQERLLKSEPGVQTAVAPCSASV